jgi:hypothetical protein
MQAYQELQEHGAGPGMFLPLFEPWKGSTYLVSCNPAGKAALHFSRN